MTKSQELVAFKKHFEASTNIKVSDTLEERQYPHWKRLLFTSLNAIDVAKISEYIINHFSTPNKFTHLSPELHSYNGYLALTVDVAEIKEFILK